MHWSDHADAIAPALPAVWLVRTGEKPRDLTERSALRRGTARRILARQLGCRDSEVAIGHDPAGRPFIALPDAPGLHLSLATRAGIVAIGLARHPLGVDIEAVEAEAPPPLDLLHPQERELLDRAAPAARPLAFARLWAAKEAYVKALGTGFARAPESFSVFLSSDGRFCVADPLRRAEASGEIRLIEDGGRNVLAAAAIVLA
ncbi:4'-phosphopantetheinyl transferase superfamily protein [Bosea sp. (in: a-proteobacteria)]|uniref:4'-phosphopantetheinyl transferase family protein n=1 Tax=Bosea sp. (in: a-proteobacteria) TaxID=1871050 RepID=UPI002602EC7C|nr:4'-phosphopantetheinyl transferase superfamily protein [Bosea sp. (in: a-proteobacteria)]MCO5092407.1 4'-phosphopantetheinyl transferase superfamily protein [Bosea sp. (in: a-proteobacteria)]